MALTALTALVQTQITLDTAVTGFADDLLTDGGQTLNYNAVNFTSWNRCFATIYSIPATSSTTYNLNAWTDLQSRSVTMTAGYKLDIYAAVGSVLLKPGSSSALVWFVSQTTQAVTAFSGGYLSFGFSPSVTTGVVIASGTCNLDIINLATTAASGYIFVFGGG